MLPSFVFGDEKCLAHLPTTKGTIENIVAELYDEEVSTIPPDGSLPFVAHWNDKKEGLKEIVLGSRATVGHLRELIPKYFDIAGQQKLVTPDSSRENANEKGKIQILPAISPLFVDPSPSTFSRTANYGQDDYPISDLSYDSEHGLLFYMLPGEHVFYDTVAEESKPITIIQDTPKASSTQHGNCHICDDNRHTTSESSLKNSTSVDDSDEINEMLSHSPDASPEDFANYHTNLMQKMHSRNSRNDDNYSAASLLFDRNERELKRNREIVKPDGSSKGNAKHQTPPYRRPEKSLTIKEEED